jgi:hypothetical protein
MNSADQILSSTTVSHTSNYLSLFRSRSTGTMHHVPRRLSSGSACETCRRRKTKCDGGQPCAFCASNRIECIHRPSRRKRSSPKSSLKSTLDTSYQQHTYLTPPPSSSSSSSSSSSLSSPPSPISSALNPPSRSGLSVMDHIKSDSPSLSKQSSCPSLLRASKKTEMPTMMGKYFSP